VEVDRRALEITPAHEREEDRAESVLRLAFNGVKGKIVGLNVARDLFYSSELQDGRGANTRATQQGYKYYLDANEISPNRVGKLVVTVPEGYYLMMGDNSPSSSDGRVWGFVPRENLVGRACFIGWPISRWRFIR